MKDTEKGLQSTYIDTPKGIFTSMGTWFHTTEKLLEEYAGELLKYEPLSKLISCADVWLRLPLNVSVWVAPLALSQFEPLVASSIILTCYLILSVVGPYCISHNLFFIPRFLNFLIPQAILYLIYLSIAFQSGNFLVALLGLSFFVLFRWEIIKKILDPVINMINDKLYSTRYEDKVLKSLLIRKSLKYRTSLAEVNEIELFIMQNLKRG